MSKHRPTRFFMQPNRRRCPSGKKFYFTQALAQAHAEQQAFSLRNKQTAYQCPHCRHWHITSHGTGDHIQPRRHLYHRKDIGRLENKIPFPQNFNPSTHENPQHQT